MTLDIFLILLTFFAVVTSLCTEATKKHLDSYAVTYASNFIVLCVSAIVGGLGMVAFYLLNDIAWTLQNIIYIFLMILSNWLGSMVGYDKIKQAIEQFKKDVL